MPGGAWSVYPEVHELRDRGAYSGLVWFNHRFTYVRSQRAGYWLYPSEIIWTAPVVSANAVIHVQDADAFKGFGSDHLHVVAPTDDYQDTLHSRETGCVHSTS